jgi:hypothetical protein
MANPQLSLSPSQPLKKVSIPWVITISYLVVLLVLPAAALSAEIPNSWFCRILAHCHFTDFFIRLPSHFFYFLNRRIN